MVAFPMTEEDRRTLKQQLGGILWHVEKTTSKSAFGVVYPPAMLDVPYVGERKPRSDMLLHYEIDWSDCEKAIRHLSLNDAQFCILHVRHSKATIRLKIFSAAPKSYEILQALVAQL
jgi:hypothetical protein